MAHHPRGGRSHTAVHIGTCTRTSTRALAALIATLGGLNGAGMPSAWAASDHQDTETATPPVNANADAHVAVASSRLDWNGELRAHGDTRRLNGQGPLAAAHGFVPGLAPAEPHSVGIDAELRGTWRPPVAWGQRWAPSLTANVLLSGQQDAGGAHHSAARTNELYASADLGQGWQLSAGKKLVAWDVGYGFRPNDVVQQEVRRTLLSVTQEGRALIQAEHFDADTATALVWVNPQRSGQNSNSNGIDTATRFAQESALAARWYRRAGALDGYLFGRAGQHTGASAGAALAWVATDALELHASVRALQRHDGWDSTANSASTLATANPWSITTQGHATQWLLGATWTGESQQSLIVEAWHDGSAPAASTWRDWQARNAALIALSARPGLPAAAMQGIAGNLAWQATPFGLPNLHQDNLFIRLAWQPEPWQLTLDTLVTPADHGRSHTAGLQWQGDRVRLNAAWRVFNGPADALWRQLPQRQTGLVAATWTF